MPHLDGEHGLAKPHRAQVPPVQRAGEGPACSPQHSACHRCAVETQAHHSCTGRRRSPITRRRTAHASAAACLLMLSGLSAQRVPAPQQLTSEVFGNLMVKLSWQPPYGWDPRTLTNSTLDQYKTYQSEATTTNFNPLSTLTFYQNFQYVSFGLKPGMRYYFRVTSVKCCSILRFQPVCAPARSSGTTCESSATAFHCTTTAGIETCHYPTDGYAETSVVAMAEPEAPAEITVRASLATGAYPGLPHLIVQWNLPNDTGTAQRQRADILGFKILRSTDHAFNFSQQIFYGLPTPTGDSEATYRYEITDGALLRAGVHYYYRIYVQNAACGPTNVTCSPFIVGGRNATVRPSRPTEIVGNLLDSTRIQLDWKFPIDTGQGGGPTNASTLENITGYRIEEDFCQPAGACTVTGANRRQLHASTDPSILTFKKTGIDSAYTFRFYIQFENVAGLGEFGQIEVISLFFPSSPQNFTARVSSVYGPLVVFLSWAIPDNTGQGPNDKLEPITEYKLFMSDVPHVYNDTNAILLRREASFFDFTVTFTQKRNRPYYFMVQAANQLGYGDNRTRAAYISEFAVDVPLQPTFLSAHVVGVRLIRLDWKRPTDTGVGDDSRPLVKFVLQQSTSATFATIQTTYEPGPLVETITVEVPTSGPNLFYFRVSAVNEVGQSSPSDPANEQGITVPSPPSNLIASIPDEAKISISWNGPADTGIGTIGRKLLSYRLEYFAEGAAPEIQYLPINITSANFTNLDHTKNYTFRVFVQNDAGWSLSADVTQQPIILPTVPLGMISYVQEPLTIRLVWQRPNNTGRGGHFEPITAYIVEMDSEVIFGGNASFTTVTEKARGLNFCAGIICTLDVTFNAARKDPYWFRVFAQNQLGVGRHYAFTNEQSVQVPTAPTGLTVRVIAPRTLFLQWVQPADTGVGGAVRALGTYTLQQAFGDNTFSDGAAIVNRSYSNTTFNATVVLPSSGPTYFSFRVFTFNDAGRSAMSALAQEQGVELPSAPILLRTRINTPLEITFFWNISEDTGVTGHLRPLTGYILQVAEEIGHATSSSFGSLWYSDDNTSPEGQAKHLSKLFSNLVKGRTYLFRVAAKNEAGTGPFAAAVSNEAISVPLPPINFEAAVRSPFQIDLQWTAPPDTGFYEADMSKILRFELEQSTDQSFQTGVSANLIASQPFAFLFNFTAPIVTKGLRHYFRVWSVNEAGRSLYPTNISEQAIDVPSTPTQLSISITAVLQLTVQWSIPSDTGLGLGVTPIRPLHVYILQVFIVETPPFGATCPWPDSCLLTAFPAEYQDLANNPNQTFTFPITTTSYVLSGLTQGKSYLVRVRATNDAGLGIFSELVNKPALDKPNAATVISAFADNPLTINLTWALSTDSGLGAAIRPQWPMGQQRIQLATDAAFTQNVFNIYETPNITNRAITGLIKGWHYYIRIFSSNMLGESLPSNTRTEHAISVPSIPLNLRVIVSKVTTRELYLTWNFPTDTGLGGAQCHVKCLSGERELTRLRLERVAFSPGYRNSPDDIFVAGTPQAPPVGTVDFIGSESFYFQPSSGTWTTNHFLPLQLNDTNLLKGHVYYYRLYVSNSVGEGDASAPRYEMAMEMPSPPRSLAVVISGELSLNTTWLAPLDNGDGLVSSLAVVRPLSKYVVQIDKTSPAFQNVNFEFDVDYPITKFRALSPTLVQGQMYYFRILAINVQGYSNASNFVNQTAILKPSVPVVTSGSPVVTNPQEITFTWYRPLDTGAIGQYWPVFYFEVHMSWAGDMNFTKPGNNTQLFNSNTINVNGVATSINAISVYVIVVTGLTVGETYHFRVFTENEAGRSLSSFVASKIAVKLPDAPANFTVTVPSPLKILINFNTPVDTGAGGRLLPVDRYILEMETGNPITEQATNFSASPFGFDGCYQQKVPPCNLVGNSDYDLGIDVQRGALGSSGMNYRPTCGLTFDLVNKCNLYVRTFDPEKHLFTVHITGLIKARSYFFRVLALNEAGLSFSSPILMEYGVDLPSVPLAPIGPSFPPGMVRLDIVRVLTFQVKYSKPLDTGLGDQRRALVSYGLQLVTADDEASLTWPASSTVAYGSGDATYVEVENGVNNVTISAGKRYFARVFAVNSAGAGPPSGYDTTGPSFDFFEPNTGPAKGGVVVSVIGTRMGDSSTTYQMFIGQTECQSIYVAQFQRSVACVVPPGVPGKQGFRLYVDGLLLRKDSVFEYQGPQVEVVNPSEGISVEGGVLVSVQGRNFGAFYASQEIAITSARSDRCKESLWTSDSSMLCITSRVAYGAKTNNTVIVRSNEIASRPWYKGSMLMYDVPAHYECSRDVDSDCYACGFAKCYEQILARAQTLPTYPVAAGEVTEVCEEAVMNFCGYGTVQGVDERAEGVVPEYAGDD